MGGGVIQPTFLFYPLATFTYLMSVAAYAMQL